MIAPIVARVGNDCVVAALGMGQKPSPAVVRINVNFGVLQERLNHRILRNELKISGIDFHRIQRFYLRVARKNLPPRARSQADNQDSFWSRAEGAKSVRTNYQVRVMQWIDIEIAVINASAKHRSILCYPNNAVAIFHHVCEWNSCFRTIAENQSLEQQGIQPRRR